MSDRLRRLGEELFYDFGPAVMLAIGVIALAVGLAGHA